MTSTDAAGVTRRGVLAGAAAIGVTSALAACGSNSAGSDSAGSGDDSAPATVPTTAVPVGGAAIVGRVVVSQVTQGSFRAFSAVCTHQQCLISRVQGTQVMCTCHNSVFSATDGSVISGPAPRSLAAKSVTQSGDILTIA